MVEEYFSKLKEEGLLAECPINGGRWHRDKCRQVRKRLREAVTKSLDGQKIQKKVDICRKCWLDYKGERIGNTTR